ncbi:MAG: HNH endonuclease [Bacteroidota bacterium]
MKQNIWTREQTIVAFNLYCKIPFNKVSSNHPEILKISKIIGRSPNSVKMKIGNFGSFDPELKKRGIVGLSNSSKLDKEVWDEFNMNWENLVFESESIIAKYAKKTLGELIGLDLENLPKGKEREAIVKTRINQSFFRSTILSSYNQKCCITGISVPQLLVASHIVPWSKNENIRLDPRNGLCLNSLHDRAFDHGFITITTDYKIIVSKELTANYKKDKLTQEYFLSFNNKSINMPDRFLPKKEYLDYHYENIFRQ